MQQEVYDDGSEDNDCLQQNYLLVRALDGHDQC